MRPNILIPTPSPAATSYLGENANHAYDPFGDWQQAEFGAEAGLPIAAPNADPDGDEISNLVEFVLGGDPQDSDSAPTPTVSHTNPSPFSFAFTPVIENGAQLEIQISGDLSIWTTLSTRPAEGGDWIAHTTVHELNIDSESGAVEVTMSGTAVKIFARLQVTL